VPDEKGFCELLNEQIIDESKATRVYKTLLGLLDEEKEMLSPTPKDPVSKMMRDMTLELIGKEIENISNTEAVHKTALDSMRKALCLPAQK